MSDDTSIYGVNDSGEACMRVSENVTSNDPTSIYGVDENGNAAVRVMGSSGGSGKHNKGWFATPTTLREAHPTAEDGDYAIVGSTDSVWVWDSDTTDWKDSGVQPTNNYEDLSNKPQINGVTLSGNKSKADLGITDNKAIEIASNTTVEGFSVPNPTVGTTIYSDSDCTIAETTVDSIS